MTQGGYKLDRQDGLTRRQREVAAGLASGRSHVEIGRELGISKQRVGQIVREIEKKDADRSNS